MEVSAAKCQEILDIVKTASAKPMIATGCILNPVLCPSSTSYAGRLGQVYTSAARLPDNPNRPNSDRSTCSHLRVKGMNAKQASDKSAAPACKVMGSRGGSRVAFPRFNANGRPVWMMIAFQSISTMV
jgi:hypothetical protein